MNDQVILFPGVDHGHLAFAKISKPWSPTRPPAFGIERRCIQNQLVIPSFSSYFSVFEYPPWTRGLSYPTKRLLPPVAVPSHQYQSRWLPSSGAFCCISFRNPPHQSSADFRRRSTASDRSENHRYRKVRKAPRITAPAARPDWAMISSIRFNPFRGSVNFFLFLTTLAAKSACW